MYIFVYCWCGAFLYLFRIKKIFFHEFQYFLINTCANSLFSLRISVAMITLNISINICFKTFRYCTYIGRITIKINIHRPNFFINVAFYFSSLKNYCFLMMQFLHQVLGRIKQSVSFQICCKLQICNL